MCLLFTPGNNILRLFIHELILLYVTLTLTLTLSYFTAEQHGSPQRGSRGSSYNQGPAVACYLLLAS